MAKILVADDNAQVRDLLELLLEDAGHQVTLCADGSEVLPASRAQRPDVVLLDLNMPDVDGFTALEQLRKDEQLRKVPVIIVTAAGRPDQMTRARDLGATDFIVKPWKDFEVEDRVDLALKSSSAG
jgi:CheY-like chemotaxis protein